MVRRRTTKGARRKFVSPKKRKEESISKKGEGEKPALFLLPGGLGKTREVVHRTSTIGKGESVDQFSKKNVMTTGFDP